MRKIVIINQKGGTGKTTSAAMIGAGLALAGKRVTLIDIDPQGSLAVWFGLSYKKSLYHLLMEGADLHDCRYEIETNLMLVPSDKTLAHAEILLASRDRREWALTEALGDGIDTDYLIFDCAPSLNLLNLNAMLYATEAFVPVAMDYLSLIGAKEVMDNLKWLREKMNHELRIGMIIPTFYDRRDRKSREVFETLSRHFSSCMAPPVRKNVKLAEAAGAHETIFTFAPRSFGAEDYQKIVQQVIDG